MHGLGKLAVNFKNVTTTRPKENYNQNTIRTKLTTMVYESYFRCLAASFMRVDPFHWSSISDKN